MNVRARSFAAMIGAGLLPWTPATAQYLPYDAGAVMTDKYLAVRDRVIPGYEQLGIPIGPLEMRATLDSSILYDSNVLAADTGARSDAFVRFRPGVTLNNRAGDYQVALRAVATIDRYSRLKTEDAETWNIGGTVQRYFGRNTNLRAGFAWEGNQEGRQSSSISFPTVEPVTWRTTSGAVGFSQAFQQLKLSVEGTYSHAQYNNSILLTGQPFSQQGRNNDLIRVVSRLSYQQSPSFVYFVQARVDQRNFQHLAGVPPRDSTEISGIGGVQFEANFPARGEIGLGYLNRKFKDPFYRNFSGFDVNAKLELFPTTLTTVTLTAQRRNEDNGQPNSSVSSIYEFAGRVDYELLRSLIITAGGRYSINTAQNIDRVDYIVGASAGAEYKVSRFIFFNVNYNHVDRNSTGADRYRSFVDDRLQVGFALRK
jgi:hypothetical protein